MDDRLQRRVQRYGWDAAVAAYEDGWSKSLAPAQDAMLDMADLQPGHEVVEAAAGTGLATFRAANAVSPGGRIAATDISGEMVNRGQTRAKQLGVTNVEFARMDSEALELESASFDRAICGLGLMYMPNPVVALAEMRRVLRPGGRASVAVWGQRSKCGWADLFPIVDARVHSEVCPMFFGLGATNALVTAMTSAGFQSIEERRITSPLRYADQSNLLVAMIDGGAVALAAKRFSAEVRREVEDEFLASVDAFRDDTGQYEIPGEFVIASAIA